MLISLSPDYVDQQDGISIRTGGRAKVHNDDIVGIFSYNIFVGIAVATIFGSGFFFDLFWPERKESKSVKLAWKICSLLVSIMALGDALALTVSVIVCAYNSEGLIYISTGNCCNAPRTHYWSISSRGIFPLPPERPTSTYLQAQWLLCWFSCTVMAGYDSIICEHIHYVEVNSA
jgi:lipid-A-disaccharide synthase-like uncharacterized protein